jgi:hypothetical protein
MQVDTTRRPQEFEMGTPRTPTRTPREGCRQRLNSPERAPAAVPPAVVENTKAKKTLKNERM